VNDTGALIASYRVQLTPSFGFADTIGILDHLERLGVSHLYLSPVAEAVPGSLHGYDVIDHTTVRADFGGESGLSALLDAAGAQGIGVVIDHVPNHMAAAEAHLNPWWWQMLRDGPASTAASWFDVDWAATDGRVLVPKLGDPLEDVLAAGGITIGEGDRGPEVRYGPLRFPLAPGTESLPLADALERQHYELMWWRDPRRNVRRFFTIDDLVAVRAENPDVAEVIDTIPARLADHPAFAGVRVDHVDGLADPEAYLHGLRRRIGDDRWLLVEKILAPAETLAPSWPVDGTTGYEHIRTTEHTFLDPTAEQPLTTLWTDLTEDHRSFAEIEDQARREVLDAGLRPDLDRLVRLVVGDVGDAREAADVSEQTRQAIVELTIGVHRYRTYLPDDPASLVELDTAHQRALEARGDLAEALDHVVDQIRSRPDVATRWEQLTSPVMAKGAEDRAFYRYLRAPSLCEVGGIPGEFSSSVDEFHRENAVAQRLTPVTMLAGTTHDTKRSEGVRARSLALAEIADDWSAVVRGWFDAHDSGVLDSATIMLALHTAVTAWPIDADRLGEYLVKSAREADEHTAWTAVDDVYEAALRTLAEELEADLLDDPSDDGLGGIVQRVLRPGWATSLSLLAVRLTAPGVPDLYQGTASFTYSLVDPDNRVEPDWDERRALVDAADGLDGPAAWLGDEIEAAKAVVITRTLALRRRRAAAFGTTAGYLPLMVTGSGTGRVMAFARTAPGAQGAQPLVVTLVAMRSSEGSTWGDTAVELPVGSWRNVLVDDAETVPGGSPIGVGQWLDSFPVAVLERTDV
jgi:(1->4)-alpha-D-glucan 1-alpha-D-glucosylmutase